MTDLFIISITPEETTEMTNFDDTDSCCTCDCCTFDEDNMTVVDDDINTRIDEVLDRLSRLEDLVVDLAAKTGNPVRFVPEHTIYEHWEFDEVKGNKRK